MIIGKIICLFLAVLMTTSNLLKARVKQGVSPIQFIVMAASITGFIVLQWLV